MHWERCWTAGPQHYECAVDYIRKLEGCQSVLELLVRELQEKLEKTEKYVEHLEQAI